MSSTERDSTMKNRTAATAAAIAGATALVMIGSTATATAAERSAASYSDINYYGSPQWGTGGLILRDVRGNNMGSGIGEGTRFKFLGACARAAGVDMIKVHQIESGGWGSSYTGYVRRAYANLPPNLPC